MQEGECVQEPEREREADRPTEKEREREIGVSRVTRRGSTERILFYVVVLMLLHK